MKVTAGARRLFARMRLRARSVWRRGVVDGDLDEELNYHLNRQVEANLAAGMPPVEARRAALLEIGGLTQTAEQCREARGLTVFDSILQDVKYGLRVLAKTPLFTTVAAGSLALGIGANTAMFTFMNALALRSLPVRDPGRLVLIRMGRHESLTYPLFRAIRSHQRVFSGVFAWDDQTFTSGVPGDMHNVRGAFVSGEYFSVLGVVPAAGRLLFSADDHVGAEPVAVLSDSGLRRRYAGSSSAMGRKININGVACTIVGVLPPDFFGTDAASRPEVFLPAILQPRLQPDYAILDDASAWWIKVMARLKPGVSIAQARANLRVIAPAVRAEGVSDGQQGLHEVLDLQPAAEGYTFLSVQYRRPFLLLFAGVGILLLIACTNLATLLLSRAESRSREIAIRLSLGAGRTRIIRQLITEGLLLAAAGGAISFVVARGASSGLLTLLSSKAAGLTIDLSADLHVLGFTAAAACIATVLFAAAPSWRATRLGIAETMKQGSATVRGAPRNILRSVLIVSEVALSVMLLAGAALFTATLGNLYRTDRGFARTGILLLPVDFVETPERGARLARLYADIAERAGSLPGVQAASAALVVPVSGDLWNSAFLPPQSEHVTGRTDARLNFVLPGYFTVFDTRLLAGRQFTSYDTADSERVAILNAAAARLFFPQGNALGSMLGQRWGEEMRKFRIVGIAENARYQDLREQAPPTVYLPLSQHRPVLPNTNIVLRTAGDPLSYARAVRGVLSELAPRATPGEPKTMAEQIDESLSTERLLTTVSLFFGLLAVLLTCIGIYGVVAYSTARRTGEIGIRMALGASGGNVLRLVLQETLLLLACGIAMGYSATLGLSRLISSFLYGLKPSDPGVLAIALAAMAGSALLAAYLPARHAARTDPIKALRYE